MRHIDAGTQMGTKLGAYNTSTDVEWNDPRAQQQAQAMGAVLRSDGKLYDARDGHNLSQDEADQRAVSAGVAVPSNRPRAGFLNQVYDRNKAYIDPIATLAATAFGGPALGAAVSSGLKYANTHDLGQSALAGATTYGLGNMGRLAQKLPGVSGVADWAGNTGVADAIRGAGRTVASMVPESVRGGFQDILSKGKNVLAGIGGGPGAPADWQNLLRGGINVAGGVQGWEDLRRARETAQAAGERSKQAQEMTLEAVRKQLAASQPVQAAVGQTLQERLKRLPSAPDLSGLYNPANPYAGVLRGA